MNMNGKPINQEVFHEMRKPSSFRFHCSFGSWGLIISIAPDKIEKKKKNSIYFNLLNKLTCIFTIYMYDYVRIYILYIHIYST